MEVGQNDGNPTGTDHILNHVQRKMYVECFYCHKKRHYKNQCKESKEHLEEKKNGNKPLESTSVAKETSDDSEVVDLLLLSLGNNVLLESWVLCSACCQCLAVV